MGFTKVNISNSIEQECKSSSVFNAALEEKKLVEKLRELRKSSGLNQIELAEKSGCTQNTVSRVEVGVCCPTLRTFCSILNALGYELKIVKRS